MIVEHPEDTAVRVEEATEEKAGEDTAATAGEATRTVAGEATNLADHQAVDTTRATLVDLLPATVTAAAAEEQDRALTTVDALLLLLLPCLKAPPGVHPIPTAATPRLLPLLAPSMRSTAAASARGRVAGETTRSKAARCLLPLPVV